MEEQFSESPESGKSFREYLSALRRRKWQILAVAAILAPIALVVALALPPVYRSTATILVQEQEVPPDLVRSTITSFADERIQVISQQVMTRAQLLELVDKYDLYREAAGARHGGRDRRPHAAGHQAARRSTRTFRTAAAGAA